MPLTRQQYQQDVLRAQAQLAAAPPDAPIRLRKRTSNLFRPRADTPATLAAEPFTGVLSVDPVARTADVLGMTTYEQLVEATLAHGLMPLVVPQLKTITLGGAVTGLGIESSSFRHGCPHESVLEMDVLTGAGEVVTATPDNEHAELFFGFPNSFGSLGYALRLTIELQPVQPFVHLRHLRFDSLPAAADRLAELVESGEFDGRPIDFLDGVWFGPREVHLTVGQFAATAPYASDYTGQGIFYRSIQQRDEDWLTVHDYLWRWDPDWFWCSRAFGAQNSHVRKVWPRRLRRSDFYWKLIALNRRYRVAERIDSARHLPEREDVVQDIEVPVSRLAEFVAFLDRRTGIEPVWLCPLRARDADRQFDLYPLEPGVTWVNVGFWSSAPLPAGATDGHHNRAIEIEVSRLGGHKSLYSTAFYPEDEFWSLYGGPAYERVRKQYDPEGRLLDLYTKTVGRR